MAVASPTIDMKVALREIGKKILILCTPWPSWRVSGCWIAEASDASATGKITATDDTGGEILSYVPLALVADFLSHDGQKIVSRSELLCVFSVLINNSNNPRSPM